MFGLIDVLFWNVLNFVYGGVFVYLNIKVKYNIILYYMVKFLMFIFDSIVDIFYSIV